MGGVKVLDPARDPRSRRIRLIDDQSAALTFDREGLRVLHVSWRAGGALAAADPFDGSERIDRILAVTHSRRWPRGDFAFTRDGGRLAVSASLDADSLSLAPLFGPPQRLIAADGGWSGAAFAIEPPRDFDLDLRLSVGRLDAYGVALDNVAASALIKDGALTANLLEATAYGGRGKGEMRLACERDAYRISTSGALEGADVGAAVRVARRLRTGAVNVNTGMFTAYAPGGGYKQSGLGRERGIDGIRAFQEVKHIVAGELR